MFPVCRVAFIFAAVALSCVFTQHASSADRAIGGYFGGLPNIQEWNPDGGGLGAGYDPFHTNELNAFGQALFGAFSLTADASFTNYPVAFLPYLPTVATWGRFEDTVTINGGSGSGVLRLAYNFSGLYVSADFMNLGATAVFDAGATDLATHQRDSVLHMEADAPGEYFVGSHWSDPIAFTFGQPFEIDAELTVALNYLRGQQPPTGAVVGHIGYDRLRLVGAEVTDALGQPVSSFSIAAESGTAYPTEFVPEPSTLAMLLASLPLGYIAYRRR
jgi:hypothetical protein